ncbi:MAG TPA: hypothetical protein PLQ15_06575 [Syntrophales bacterium]|nr:hypothetical protein [Syntrophobacterales bacterium]HQL90250.1 hypothetical protein [Syntrophales bacterium]
MTKPSAGKLSSAKKQPKKKPAPKKKAAPNPRVEALEDIKMRGLYLHGYAITHDSAPIVFDTEEYRMLVDQFYEENRDIVTPVVHRACRENYEFFMTMVEKALNHFNDPDR